MDMFGLLLTKNRTTQGMAQGNTTLNPQKNQSHYSQYIACIFAYLNSPPTNLSSSPKVKHVSYRLRVAGDRSSETSSTAALAGRVDGDGGHSLHKLEQLRLGCTRVTQHEQVHIPTTGQTIRQSENKHILMVGLL